MIQDPIIAQAAQEIEDLLTERLFDHYCSHASQRLQERFNQYLCGIGNYDENDLKELTRKLAKQLTN